MVVKQLVLPAPEWEALVTKSPEVAKPGFEVDLISDPVELQQKSNAQREAMALKIYSQLGLDKAVKYVDYNIATRDEQRIPLRAYRPVGSSDGKPSPALVYFHGGGMLIGSLDGEVALASLLANALGTTVLHVCYRHTPQYKHPTQHEDSWDGLEWILAHAEQLHIDPAQVSVGGVSAGATLAASITLAETRMAIKENRPQRIRGQVLVVPWLVMSNEYPFELVTSREKSSRVQTSLNATLPEQRLALFTKLYDALDPKDSLHNFLFTDPKLLSNLPKTAIIVHGGDILRDEGLFYAQKLEELGVPTKVHIFKALPHAFRIFPGLPQNKRCDELFAESVLWTLGKSESGTSPGQWVDE
ncbi:hypothetical protein MRS44_000018 [Fusarium solani]|nr:hypothetical protein MRS44_000018 [Fusarium solani]